MTSMEPANLNHSTELSPWIIITQSAQAGDSSQLAVWRVGGGSSKSGQASGAVNDDASGELDALALFSDQVAAERYAELYCTDAAPSFQVTQFSATELLSILAECYRMGMRYAALNPSGTTTQQLFILRDVLSAAQKRLFSRAREQGETDDHGNGSDH